VLAKCVSKGEELRRLWMKIMFTGECVGCEDEGKVMCYLALISASALEGLSSWNF